MRQFLLHAVISLASLVTAANVQRSEGALIVINDTDFIYLPSAKTDNPAYQVFDEPKPVSKAVVAASPSRYQEISGTGLYKCILYWPDLGIPSNGIYEMRGSIFEILQFDLDMDINEQIFATGAICYVLPGIVDEGGKEEAEEKENKQEKEYVAVWVNGEEQGEIGKMMFVEKLNKDEDNDDGSYDDDNITMFEGGPQSLTDAIIIDWTGRDMHLTPSDRGDVGEPFCRLVEEDGRYAGLTHDRPLEEISGTFVGVACENR